MDGKQFDRLAKELAGGESRRGFLRKIAGMTVAVGGVALARPQRAAAGDDEQCSEYEPCTDYDRECLYGECVCKSGLECDGQCVDGECCGDYQCQGSKVCEYGTCVCPDYQQDCNGKCIDQDACCADDDCGEHEKCSDYGCVCEYGYKDCDGTCIPDSDCCSDYDCDYGVCDYGTCSEEPAPEPEDPICTTALMARCQGKCMKSGRTSAKKRKKKVNAARLRSSCKSRCARNCN